MNHSKSAMRFFVLPILLLSLLPTKVMSCTCEIAPPTCYQYWREDAVFVGQIVAVEPDENFVNERVNVKVVENFKGTSRPLATTYNYNTSCSFRFVNDQKFLFYTGLDEKDQSQFGTSFCSRTRRFSDDLIDLEFLQAVKEKRSTFWIWVTVTGAFPGVPMSNVRAEIIGRKDKLTGVSDESGDLKIVVPGEGKYRVRVWIPKGKEHSGSLRLDEQIRNEQFKIYRGAGKYRKKPFVDFEVDVTANHCGWIDLALMSMN